MEAWKGYAAFPRYVIYPRAITEPRAGWVAVLGHTTGSHLGLTDLDERALAVIWLAEVRNGQLRCWRLLTDTPGRRSALGLAQALGAVTIARRNDPSCSRAAHARARGQLRRAG